MPWILMKNNLKLMLRSKWILLMMILMPLITIALLSNAFRSMLNTNYAIEEFKVGYRLNGNSSYEPMLGELQKACKEQNILLEKYPQGEIAQMLQNRTVAVFVEIEGNVSYKIYHSNEKKIEASVTESIFSDFFYRVKEAVTIETYASQNKVEIPELTKSILMQEEILPTDPIPSAVDYYGIVYIVYFAWCGLISLVAVISSERKSAIPRRMRITRMSKLSQYLGKFIPCSAAIFIETCTSWILSLLLFDIHWGNMGVAVLIIALISMASSTIGIVLFQLFNNVAIGIVIGFVTTWIWGFFGGAFQSYMYLDIPRFLIESSPIYHINRTLVEYSTKGYSNNTMISIGYLLTIITIGGICGILLINRKTEE